MARMTTAQRELAQALEFRAIANELLSTRHNDWNDRELDWLPARSLAPPSTSTRKGNARLSIGSATKRSSACSRRFLLTGGKFNTFVFQICFV